MREIMFRGWNSKNKKWIYGYYFVNRGEHFISPDEVVNPLVSYNDFVVDKDSVGQYTGLRDKNGVEIYEGDILQELSRGEYAEATGIPLSELEDLPADAGRMVSVVYNAPSFEFAPNEYGYIFLNNPHLFRVIGNVHENHELMKGGSREA